MTLFCNIFIKRPSYIQDNKYKILSESTQFCRRCDKNIWCVFRFAVPIAVHLQNVNLEVSQGSVATFFQVSWKTFKLLYHKLIQDNVYQILSESTGFCGRYDKKHFWCFLVHSVVQL